MLGNIYEHSILVTVIMTYLYRCDHTSWYLKGPVIKALDHPCSKCARCISKRHLFDPTPCHACTEHLRAASISGEEGDHARSQFTKWEGTMVTKWRNARVAEYLPTSVHSFIWDSEELKASWNPPLRFPLERKRKRTSSPEQDSVRSHRTPSPLPPLTHLTVEAEVHPPPTFLPPPPGSPIINATAADFPNGAFLVVESQPGPSSRPNQEFTAAIEAMEGRMAKNIEALVAVIQQNRQQDAARFEALERSHLQGTIPTAVEQAPPIEQGHDPPMAATEQAPVVIVTTAIEQAGSVPLQAIEQAPAIEQASAVEQAPAIEQALIPQNVITQNVITATPLPQSVITATPLPQNVITATPLPQNVITDTALPTGSPQVATSLPPPTIAETTLTTASVLNVQQGHLSTRDTAAPPMPPPTTTPTAAARSIPLVDIADDDEHDLPPTHLKRTDSIHHEAHLWLEELREEEEDEPDLFPHPKVLQHDAAIRYYVSDVIKYQWFKGVPCLVTLWQQQTTALPVDQSWVKVREEAGDLIYYLASPSALVPEMFRPFIIKGATSKPTPGPSKVTPKDFRPFFTPPIKDATTLHPPTAAASCWTSTNASLLSEVCDVEKSLPDQATVWSSPLKLTVSDTALHEYLHGTSLTVRAPSEALREIFALFDTHVPVAWIKQEHDCRQLALSALMLRESTRLSGDLIARGSLYNTLKLEQAPTFTQLMSLQRDTSAFCMAQATALFHFHLRQALQTKRAIVRKVLEKVEPMELKVLLRAASLICPNLFPLSVLEQGQAVVIRSLDSSVMRGELKTKITRSLQGPSRRSEQQQPFRGPPHAGGYHHHRQAFASTRGNTYTSHRRGNTRDAFSRFRGGHSHFSKPSFTTSRSSWRGRAGAGSSYYPPRGASTSGQQSRGSAPRGRSFNSRRGRYPRGSR